MRLILFLRILLCITGLGLSVYALHVEMSKFEDRDYKALCDISEHMSCSKVFSSKYGSGFGIVGPLLGERSSLNAPNSLFGIAFYTIVCLLGFSKSKVAAVLNVIFSIMSCIGSVYLGYILYFVLHDICVVCISTYVVNGLLFLVNLVSYRQLPTGRKTKRE